MCGQGQAGASHVQIGASHLDWIDPTKISAKGRDNGNTTSMQSADIVVVSSQI